MSSALSFPGERILLLLFGIVDLSLALFLFALNASFIRSLFQHKSLLRRNIVVVSLSLVVTISFALYPTVAGSACMVRLHGYLSGQDLNALEHELMIPTAPLYWTTQSLMVLLFIVRINNVFGATQWALGRRRRQALFASATVLILLSTSITVPLAIDNHAESATLVLLSLWTLLHFTLSVLLIVLFTRKLHWIIVKSNQLERRESETQENTMRENELFQLAVKHNILVRFAIISTLLTFLITFGILATDNASVRFISGTANSLDCAVSSVCVYLLFAFHHELYAKICFRIHRRCEKRKAQQLESVVAD